jgi:beta-galactosidase/beta-glucuronidase
LKIQRIFCRRRAQARVRRLRIRTHRHSSLEYPPAWHSFDDKIYKFVSIHWRRFKAPPEATGRHVFVDFEGVMTASTVWISVVRLGGQAMPGRAQCSDARILRHKLKRNIVRTSHYPQSRHFVITFVS